MTKRARHVLITGRPGSGKTTLVRNLARRLQEARVPLFGFWTEEIRERGRRVGFGIELVGGQRSTLAHEDLRSGPPIGAIRQLADRPQGGPEGPRVSRYRVDVAAFESLAVPEMERAVQAASRMPAVLIVDEIGKMELFSSRFKEVLLRALESPLSVVATILAAPSPFTDGIKARRDVSLVTISAATRERIGEEIFRSLAQSAR